MMFNLLCSFLILANICYLKGLPGAWHPKFIVKPWLKVQEFNCPCKLERVARMTGKIKIVYTRKDTVDRGSSQLTGFKLADHQRIYFLRREANPVVLKCARQTVALALKTTEEQ